MLNGELNSRIRLNGELTGGVFYGTNDYTELINKPSINGVELEGNKTTSELGIDIPTATSQLTNDSGFITDADVPTKTSELDNDSGFITSADVSAAGLSGDYDDLINKPTIPTLTSQLTNDSGFINNAQVPTMTSQLFNDSGFITSADVPTKTSELDNDSGFITAADIPTDVSAFTNDAGYITASDLLPATASGSIATFADGGDNIPVKTYECDIVAQQASGTPTPDNPLLITGFSQADITVTDNDQITNLYTVAFGQTIYGGRLIYKDGEWAIEATHGYDYLSTSDTWNYSSGWSKTNTNVFYGTQMHYEIKFPDFDYPSFAKCSHLGVGSRNEVYEADTNMLGLSGNTTAGQLTVRIDKTICPDLASFIQWITDNQVYYVYELATPVIIPITSATRVKTISGDNNIFSNTGDNSVKYFTENADSLAELIKAFVL